MSDDAATGDDLDAIRERKLERLRSAVENPDATATADAAASAPNDPIRIDGEAHLADLTDRYDVVLADFSAEWCGPCRTLEPIVERVADRTPAAVATIDIDDNGALARQYNVRGVPTLVLFAEGEPVERFVGVQEESVLVDLIDSYA